MRRTVFPKHTYNNGQPYSPARGRRFPAADVQYRTRLVHPVVTGKPGKQEFLDCIKRELKIRFYCRNTIKNYLTYLTGFLDWLGHAPHRATLEHVREYLEMIVDSGASSSQLAGILSAIRTAFDKFCGRDITLGLATPRRKRSQPVILSRSEVEAIIQASTRRDIKLAIGLMYAAGLRNSEVCRLRVKDLDFDRNTIRIEQGKGRCDRVVAMPGTFFQALSQICQGTNYDDFLFPSREYRNNRHISPRTLQRWVSECACLAQVKKRVTPHSFRHAFATHLLENGTDIRFIQKLLGHKRLETSTIYTQLAKLQTSKYQTPFDALSLHASQMVNQTNERQHPKRVGTLKIACSKADDHLYNISLVIQGNASVELDGIVLRAAPKEPLAVSFPVLEHWESKLSELPEAQRQRINSVGFIGLMHQAIVRQFYRHQNKDH